MYREMVTNNGTTCWMSQPIAKKQHGGLDHTRPFKGVESVLGYFFVKYVDDSFKIHLTKGA